MDKHLNRGERRRPPLPRRGDAVKVGDRVSRVCVTLTGQDGLDSKCPARMTGQIVWVHPQGRFHVVEFQLGGGAVRECFFGEVNAK